MTYCVPLVLAGRTNPSSMRQVNQVYAFVSAIIQNYGRMFIMLLNTPYVSGHLFHTHLQVSYRYFNRPGGISMTLKHACSEEHSC